MIEDQIEQLKRRIIKMDAQYNMATCDAKSPVQETLRDRLMRNKSQLEQRLAEINKALELIEKNPLLEEFHNVITRAY